MEGFEPSFLIDDFKHYLWHIRKIVTHTAFVYIYIPLNRNIGIRTQIRLSLFDVRTPLYQLSYVPME